jgi:AcrR family transcriptional regulator
MIKSSRQRGKRYLPPMAVRPYVRSRPASPPATETRVLAAAEEMIKSGFFHRATVSDLAEKASVARATVFGRFKSKLGVLEALSTRCAGGPEIRAIREAFAADDPRAAVPAVVAAACAFWERQGHILVTLKAIVELESGALAIIEAQREDQASSCATLAKRLQRAGALRPGLRAAAAGPMLHMLTSVESFLELRRHGGMSLDATRAALTELAQSLLA